MRLVDKYGEPLTRSEALDLFGIPHQEGAAVERLVEKKGFGTDPFELYAKAERRAMRIVGRLINNGRIRTEDRVFALKQCVGMLLDA